MISHETGHDGANSGENIHPCNELVGIENTQMPFDGDSPTIQLDTDHRFTLLITNDMGRAANGLSCQCIVRRSENDSPKRHVL